MQIRQVETRVRARDRERNTTQLRIYSVYRFNANKNTLVFGGRATTAHTKNKNTHNSIAIRMEHFSFTTKREGQKKSNNTKNYAK